ncbi:SDR family NAD(P)-dependent oxidoreductase [Arthrobacter crystallopoietes]|uniref:NAD(P)-dependent dehydrogenase, short-chain alcohol dehydrogenase family n=1 Tax=Crystallibacter crystallopoietes TaxID=37928 RepID=A0A1H1AQB6_9MICC|nr:SDR family oxidoreductase [Arthrobacter crystallopoietes]AUI51444.1 3-oxoacyl-ACP reductase [Arthrobacter crystallopoietes]SDQ41691.1 NAD(P)-dependent dehydrogenase, short-chain alcohol dehydrogenase family [Arthrobacter crystallopoietes]
MDYTQLFQFSGDRVLVIGAGSGIGREAALALGAHGATVVCADRDSTTAAETAAMIGGSAIATQLDVLDLDAVRAAADEFSDISALVFTAAMNVRKRIADYTMEEFDRVVNLNLRSSFSLIQAFAPKMAANGGGSIIGFASIRAYVVEPGQGVYAATKAALVQLARTAAAEFGPDGVRVNVIAPGVVETPLTAQIKNNPEWYNAYAQKGALGRWSKPEELAGAVVYLASNASNYVTGSVLMVDGGWTAVDGRFDPPNS